MQLKSRLSRLKNLTALFVSLGLIVACGQKEDQHKDISNTKVDSVVASTNMVATKAQDSDLDDLQSEVVALPSTSKARLSNEINQIAQDSSSSDSASHLDNSADEKIKASAQELINQYQRRNDLLASITTIAKQYMDSNHPVLSKVVESRAQIGRLYVAPKEFGNVQAIDEYIEAQEQLSDVLGDLLTLMQQYPELKADPSFQELLVMLEGTENRIWVAKKRYEAAQLS